MNIKAEASLVCDFDIDEEFAIATVAIGDYTSDRMISRAKVWSNPELNSPAEHR
jgi:hypothetical protein